MTFFRFPWAGRKLFAGWTWKIPSEDMVYLTFDDGPTEELTPWILSQLQERNIKATFFCVGSNARNLPQLMDSIRAAGHVVGNHTMNHEKGTKTTAEDYLKSIKEAAQYTSGELFRPPYGKLPMGHSKLITEEYNVIMWTWLSYDYDKEIKVDTILNSAESIRAGDILVLHDNVKVKNRLQEILPALLDILERKKLRFGLISA